VRGVRIRLYQRAGDANLGAGRGTHHRSNNGAETRREPGPVAGCQSVAFAGGCRQTSCEPGK